LRDRLSRLPHRERESVLRYYAGVFDRAGPSADEETMRGLGTPESVASRILDDWERKMEAGRSCSSSGCGAGGHYRGPGSSSRWGLGAFWAVVLAVLAAPIALPALLGLLGLAFGGFAALAAVGIAAIGLIIGGAAAFIGGFAAIFTSPATAIIVFGAAFLLWGIGKILFSIIGAAIALLTGFLAWAIGSGGRYER